MPDQDVVRAACHCRSVQFEVRLAEGLRKPRRCNCSMCRMRGAVAVTARLDGLRILSGAQHLTEYRFNTGVARHYFCARCGIYTHHQRRSNPDEFGVNAACIDGVSPFDFAEVPVMDGEHHPSDTGRDQVAGVLRFDARGES